ncbi:hypothetical protein E1A91_A11G077600v1 [Gossypium mustelinum]|uniref:Uncharacterized protein n=1 Tax=Gossypium mustelinum TaxID=34275 RepID=A0A5D2X346_GOSMU|nr:hypothetical protein E1A91_A11G077600v1 [Gossypium mustelinum]
MIYILVRILNVHLVLQGLNRKPWAKPNAKWRWG